MYKDEEMSLRDVRFAADFMLSNIKILGLVTKIMFDDPSSLLMRDHPLTIEEEKI